MTKREINRRVRELRAERKRWLTGAALDPAPWYGMPWCSGGPGCQGPSCEGCAAVAYCRERAGAIDRQIKDLLDPPVLEGVIVTPEQMAMF